MGGATSLLGGAIALGAFIVLIVIPYLLIMRRKNK